MIRKQEIQDPAMRQPGCVTLLGNSASLGISFLTQSIKRGKLELLSHRGVVGI